LFVVLSGTFVTVEVTTLWQDREIYVIIKPYIEIIIFTDCIGVGGNSATSVRLFLVYLWNRLTVDLELLNMTRS